MIRYQLTQRIHRSPAEVYDFVAVHQAENHPKWEREVVEVRRPGPLAVGLAGVMVRKEWGQVSEVPFEVVDLEPNRRISFRSGKGGFHLHLVFEMLPCGSETDFNVTVELTLSGALRLMTPMFALRFPGVSKRITGELARLLNGPESRTEARPGVA